MNNEDTKRLSEMVHEHRLKRARAAKFRASARNADATANQIASDIYVLMTAADIDERIVETPDHETFCVSIRNGVIEILRRNDAGAFEHI